jgi:hypothetical protein
MPNEITSPHHDLHRLACQHGGVEDAPDIDAPTASQRSIPTAAVGRPETPGRAPLVDTTEPPKNPLPTKLDRWMTSTSRRKTAKWMSPSLRDLGAIGAEHAQCQSANQGPETDAQVAVLRLVSSRGLWDRIDAAITTAAFR